MTGVTATVAFTLDAVLDGIELQPDKTATATSHKVATARLVIVPLVTARLTAEAVRRGIAESHYLAAKRLKPNNPDVHRNLGILYDLYMGKLPEALSLYEQYGALMDTPDPALKGWIIDIKHRIKTQTKHLETALTER